jgi:Ca-activated chloride channel family protein
MMMRSYLIRFVILGIILFQAAVFGQLAESNTEDKTLSPYFFVRSEDTSVDQLPLRETTATVDISGVIADVKVTQVYKNEGQTTIEAVYIFPASTRAAVYAMKMTIGERVIEAKIDKKEKARSDYNQAIAEGRTASLLEQQRPNVFQMNVGNILPGDEISVELFYTETLKSEDKLYEFVYPTVVGPRYSNQNESGSEDNWIKNPYLTEGKSPTYLFDINIALSAGLPISEILSTSHDVEINYSGKDKASIELSGTAKNSGNRDFILKYKLAGERIRPGLLLYEGDKEKFFLLMLQPPKRIRVDEIPGREYVFVVDVSGSMNGFPLDISKKLLRNLIGNLRRSDRFNVVLFAAGSSILSEHSLPATKKNIARAIHLIDNEHGGGGTELLPALKRALALPREENFSRTIVIATDGYVSVEKQTFDLIRNNLGKANMFAFGIGSSVNRFLIEGMARAGMGESFVITNPGEAEIQAEKFRKYISTPVLTNISYTIDDLDAYDVEPRTIPDVLSERPVMIFGKWRGEKRGAITVTGLSGAGKTFFQKINLSDYEISERNNALKYLWARYRILLLNDYNQISNNPELIEKITNLGLTYNLLTEYTSFVATDTEIRNASGKPVTVKQPLPLPQGVSNMALAGVISSGSRLGNPGGGWHKVRKSGGVAPALPQTEALEESPDSDDSLTQPAQLDQVYAASDALERDTRKNFNSSQSAMQACYKNSTAYGKSGIISVELVLKSNGTVNEIKLIKNELSDMHLIECLKKIILTWNFKTSLIQNGEKIVLDLKFTI